MIRKSASVLAVIWVGMLLVAQSMFAASDKFPELEQPVFVQGHADLITS